MSTLHIMTIMPLQKRSVIATSFLVSFLLIVTMRFSFDTVFKIRFSTKNSIFHKWNISYNLFTKNIRFGEFCFKEKQLWKIIFKNKKQISDSRSCLKLWDLKENFVFLYWNMTSKGKLILVPVLKHGIEQNSFMSPKLKGPINLFVLVSKLENEKKDFQKIGNC